MYSQYNSLQKTQLHCQQYEDTQKTRIIIYAPDRCVLLKKSLECQLHGNYHLHTALDEVLNEPCQGVLLASEDLELMSISLMMFAKEIANGADVVYSDEVFGAALNTTRFYTEKRKEKSFNAAVVSKEIFVKIAHRTNDIKEMICLAVSEAEHIKHIQSPLISYRRPIQASDLFSEGKKRALVLCHEFSMTGAPIVLVSAIPVLAEHNFEVVVCGPEYDAVVKLFLDENATVITNENNLNDDAIYSLALNSDLIIANTVVEADAVNLLSEAPVPVLWWLHDAFFGYPFIEERLPSRQADNVKICAVGKHATKAMLSVRPEFKIEQLIYGLSDYTEDSFEMRDFNIKEGTLFFANVGSFEERKGQDILAEAILKLTPDEIEKAVFLFVGRVLDQRVFNEVSKLTEKYPKNVLYIERLTRDEIKSLMSQCSGVICSSTDDPMPTFVTEAAMFAKPAIVSENTGTAGLITQGVDGFVYRNNSPEELCEVIRKVINEPDCLERMRPNCRRFYEEYFTKEVFAKTLGKYINELTGCR